MKPYFSTLFHILELIIILGVVYTITKVFPELVPTETVKDAVIVIMAGLIKFARSSPAIPVEDYVNDKA